MNKIRQYLFIQVPQEHKEELAKKVNNENLIRLMIGQIALILSQAVLVSFIFAHWAVYVFILFNLILFPIFWLVYKRNLGYLLGGRIIQYLYIIGVLLYSCSPIFFMSKELGVIQVFPYLIVVFAIASFIYLPPLASFLLFFAFYIVYLFICPNLSYQSQYFEPGTLSLLRANILVMNLLAWLLSLMVYRSKINSFIDKRIILEQNLKIKDLAIRDSLTGLFNHEHLYKRLCEEIDRAERLNHTFSLIMIDIDDFRFINDHYGHQTGNKIIAQLARLLVDTCRSTDIIGRYGGEEFMIIMPDTPVQSAVNLAERIRQAVQTTQFEKGVKISLSGGLCQYQHESAEELIKKVDDQLYKAKASGKNKFEQA